MTKHSFGGPWTQIKLDVLARYLQFFNTALQDQPSAERRFKRVYIDAFAGTGQCDIRVGPGNTKSIEGSAQIAVAVSPPFDEIHLVDLKHKHAEALQLLADLAPNRRIVVHEKDANTALHEIINGISWQGARGVLFLDPYGMAARWESLERIAATKALDVWYLFPISAVCRQAANDYSKIDQSKAAALDGVFGTSEWRTVFYGDSGQAGLFDQEGAGLQRLADYRQIATWVHQRLSDIFAGWVSPPILLPDKGSPQFALFFAVSNPSEKAVKLSKKAAEHLFDMLRTQKIGKVRTIKDNSEPSDQLF